MINAKEAKEISDDTAAFFKKLNSISKNILVDAMNGKTYHDIKDWRNTNQGIWEMLSSNGYKVYMNGLSMRIDWTKIAE